MANDFSSDPNCIALWRFEDGALDVDSKGTDTLNFSGSPSSDTTNYKEGASAITLLSASTQYGYITDTNLSSSFPLKSGVTTTQLTVCCWVRPMTVDTNKRRIWAKYNTTGNQRSIELYHYSNRCYFAYSTTGSDSREVDLGYLVTQMTANQWHHITLIVDWEALTWQVSFHNETAGTNYNGSGTLVGAIYLSTADWRIGTDDNPSANLYLNGQIDELVVFNRVISIYEAHAIRGGQFPLTGTPSWHIDPSAGLDSNTGLSWADAWKTLQQYFNPGDVIKVAKSSESVLAGTVTVTNGSEVITTTDDLTGSVGQYSFVKIGTDDVPYMVWASTSSTLTFHRAYRGTSGSGKSISLVTPTSYTTTTDWKKKSGDGVSGSLIYFNGGYDTSTDTRDGYTVINWNNNYTVPFNAWHYFWEFSNLYVYYTGVSIWYGAVDCNFNDCGYFRVFPTTVSNYQRRCTYNGFVGQAFKLGDTYNCIINDLETGNPNNQQALFLNGEIFATAINRWTNAGWSGAIYGALNFEGTLINDLTIVDAIFDELGKGCCLFALSNYAASINNMALMNPTLGSGDFAYLSSQSYYVIGTIGLQHVNGDPTDNRLIIMPGFSGSTNGYGVLSSDNSIYRTSAPSAKLEMLQCPLPFKITHYAPCDANTEYSVSVYFRKNSSYGSNNLPTMQLGWFTGTDSDLTYNTAEESMSDVDDTFSQVLHSVTPGVTGTIEINLIFYSENSGAIAWYDDLEIS